MRKKLSFTILLIYCLLLSGCCLVHDWKDATCDKPVTCSKCGEVQGEALGHKFEEATCVLPKTCSVCGATEGEPLGHTMMLATCQRPMTCSVCGYSEGDYADHDWVEATCLRAAYCSVCGEKTGTTKEHNWVSANYNSAKYCSICGMVEGDVLTPAFEKRQYEFTLEKGTSWDYTTIANGNEKTVTGRATIIDYRKYKSDSNHPSKEGYEWREATLEVRSNTGIKVMVGYTDTYAGLEDYATSDYITYPDGTRLPVEAVEEFRYEWQDETCISYANLAVRVPEDYEDLVFYVSNADYANTQRVDPNVRFMEMK